MSTEAETLPAPAPEPARKGGALLPVVLVVLLVPALCYVVMEFLVVPRFTTALEKVLQASAGSSDGQDSHAATPANEGGAHGEHTVDFGPIIVNLSGASSSRYLRTNFVLASSDPKIAEIIKEHDGALRDTTIGVLSSQTLEGLDAGGGRDSVRTALIEKLNATLGSQIVRQVYFSEFVVQ